MNFEKIFKSLKGTYFTDRRLGVETHLRRLFPGNYTVEQFYNAETCETDFRLIFDSSEDEIFFKLKYL